MKTMLGLPSCAQEGLPTDKRMKKSAENMARTGLPNPIMDDVVVDYAASMEEGADFPAVVLYESKKKFVIIDGNQRCNGFGLFMGSKREAKVSAYVVQADDELAISLITRCFNRINGRGQSREEASLHIAWIVKNNLSSTAESLAYTIEIPLDDVTRVMRQTAIADTLEEHGVKTSKMNATHFNALGTLKNDLPVMIRAAEIVEEYDVSGTETKEIVRDVKSCKSEKARLCALERAENNKRAGKPRRRRGSKPPVFSKLTRMFGPIFTILAQCPTREHLHLGADGDYRPFVADWEKLKTLLDKALGK